MFIPGPDILPNFDVQSWNRTSVQNDMAQNSIENARGMVTKAQNLPMNIF